MTHATLLHIYLSEVDLEMKKRGSGGGGGGEETDTEQTRNKEIRKADV